MFYNLLKSVAKLSKSVGSVMNWTNQKENNKTQCNTKQHSNGQQHFLLNNELFLQKRHKVLDSSVVYCRGPHNVDGLFLPQFANVWDT